ncbi:MAG: hypothetical protein KJ583_06630 [Nanoarchaeota archaeon]|nr:hypothetical protein [Nanoarchaeota archaeon]MBU1269066.1 hypothetical protein [Nanoarchaeota archaeon]MBU1604961.1 hypothetical protein [Nanoarchaeota archaeon]MBU2443309.1 hypothetical protein [Nanoarchaeota archaeon]
MVKRPLSLLFIIIILCSSSVLAFDRIFNNYVYVLDTFKVESDVFFVKGLNNDGLSLVLQKNNDELFFIKNGTCEDTDYYQYCFYDTKLDYMNYGRPIPDTMSWEPAIKVEVYSKKPSVKVSRSVQSEINKDQKTIVTVTIDNGAGKLDLSNLSFQEFIPNNTSLSSLSPGMTYKDGFVNWSGKFLKSGSSTSFSYSLEPKSYESIVLSNGTLYYSYKNSTYSVKSSSSTIKINSPFSFTSTISKSKPSIDEVFTATFTVKNKDWNDNMQVELNFLIPQSITVTSVSGNLERSNNIKKSFSLSQGKTETFTISMKSGLENNYSIKINTVMKIRDDVVNNTNFLNASVLVPKMVPEISTSKTEISDDSDFKVTAYITNPSNIYYRDISGVVQISGYETRKVSIDVIKPGEKVKLFEDLFKPEKVEKKTTLNLTLMGSYRTPAFQQVFFEKTAKIFVVPTTISFNIVKTASKKDVYPGDNITITVKVKNTGQKKSLIFVNESIPFPFELSGGLTSKNISLSSNEEKEFYIYKLNIPDNTTLGTYNLTTILDYKEGNFSKTSDLSIVVKSTVVEDKKKDEVNTAKNNTAATVKKKTPEKKKNIIDIIVNFFVGIFR